MKKNNADLGGVLEGGGSRNVQTVLREARAFSHSNVELTYLEQKKLRGGEQRNKNMIQDTLSSLTVANVKGEVILKGSQSSSLLKVERFKKIGIDQQSIGINKKGVFNELT